MKHILAFFLIFLNVQVSLFAQSTLNFEQEEFLYACANGDIETIREVLSHKTDIHIRDENGNNGLHISIFNQQLEVAELLINKNISIEQKNALDLTPLELCLIQADDIITSEKNITYYDNLIKLFFEHIYQLPTKDYLYSYLINEKSLLHCEKLRKIEEQKRKYIKSLVQNKQTKMIRQLIIQNKFSKSPYFVDLAISQKLPSKTIYSMVNYVFKENNNNEYIQNPYTAPSRYIKYFVNSSNSIQELQEGLISAINRYYSYGTSINKQWEALKLVKLYSERIMKLGKKGTYTDTVLITNENADLFSPYLDRFNIKVLSNLDQQKLSTLAEGISISTDLDKLKTISTEKKDWESLIQIAAIQGNTALLDSCIKNNAPITLKQGDLETTVLHLAAQHGKTNILKYFMDRNVNPNILDSQMNTPLLLSVQNKHLPTCEYLILQGANIEQKNKDGQSPLLLLKSYDADQYVTRIMK